MIRARVARRRAGSPLALLAALVIVTSGCTAAPADGGTAAETDPASAAQELPGARIEITGDTPLAWTVGEEAPVFSVIVLDDESRPRAGEELTVRIVHGPAELSGGVAVVESGPDGVASITGITPNAAGTVTVEVASGTQLATLDFRAE